MKAFSLLELVLILAIVSTLAAIAAPRYGNALAHYRAESGARRIAADLDLARATARKKSASITVSFDAANDSYEMFGVQNIDHPADNAGVVLSAPPYSCDLVSAAFGVDQDIVFDGYGDPDTGGTVIVSCGSFTSFVVVAAETGEATVQ